MKRNIHKYWGNPKNREKHSILLKEKIPKGKNHHLWKGGVNSENHIIRHSLKWKQWRKLIFERDNYTCQFCKEKVNTELHPHHIYTFSNYPDLRFDINNGITLCIECHRKTIGKEKLFIDKFLNQILKIEKQ